MNSPTFSPRSIDECFAIRNEHPSAVLLAGGTDVLARLKDSLDWPPLIDISRVEELKGISAGDGHIRVGALTTYTEITHSDIIAQRAGVLAQAAQTVGSPQIRNRGTIGGNLANASPAGDTIPPLYVLDAAIELVSEKGSRTIPVTDFFTGPGKTVLQPREMIASVRIPINEGWRGVFVRLGQRAALAISKVSLAVCVKATNGHIDQARISLGAVAPTVIRAPRTEELLAGADLSDDLIKKACEMIREEASPITDIRSVAEYRRDMCGVLLERGLKRIIETKSWKP